jgi:hypothetical protein
LSVPGNREAWFRIEVAKRRLVYTLLDLGIPLSSKMDDPKHGLAFELLANVQTPGAGPVLTGHKDGVITINIAEADDSLRERTRTQMHEPYRTLLGHFRHEIGHYYWDRLIRDTAQLGPFRDIFGDEREDYAAALARYYQNGAPGNWPNRFVSAYASSHSWEDWAESWAHYLHMIDTLETAASCGLTVKPRRAGEPSLPSIRNMSSPFQNLLQSWITVTYVLNNLNRGLGLNDAYPFVLSPPATEKREFIHEIITKTKTEEVITATNY